MVGGKELNCLIVSQFCSYWKLIIVTIVMEFDVTQPTAAKMWTTVQLITLGLTDGRTDRQTDRRVEKERNKTDMVLSAGNSRAAKMELQNWSGGKMI